MTPDKNMMRTFFWILVLFILCFGFGGGSTEEHNQKSSPQGKQFTIKWIETFSSDQDFNKKTNLFSNFLNLILGHKNLKLIKPVAVISSKSKTLQILDQGRRSLVLIDQNKANFKEAVSFPSIVSICANEKSDLFFTDSQLNKVFIYKENDKKLVVLNDSLNLNRPTGIAYSQKNHSLWVVETGAHLITILDTKGNVIKQIGKRGTAKGEFNYPTFIWIDQNGLAYVIDSMNFRVQVFDSDGTLISVFGQPGDASGYFGRPKGIATDSFGNIYVVDALFHTVQIFNKTGNFLNYFGRQGRDNGDFWMPSGIYIDKQDRIFIADTYNARIQMFQLSMKDSNAK